MTLRVEPVLQGLRVLDLTRLLPGPLCTMLMADYGADVIKVEDPVTGDPTRLVGGGAFFRHLNRNKKSVALDLKDPRGKAALLKMAAGADVLVEGFRPGVMERLGLQYAAVKAENPRLIYVSISGYGQTGPYRERAGHDLNYTALAGLLDLSSAPGEGPVMPGVQIADTGGGAMMALSSVLMALYRRGRTGEGARVDVSMTDGLLPFMAYAAAGWAEEGTLPGRGRGHITGAYACYNLYRTAGGGYMSLGALEPHFWANFCAAIGRPEWIPLQFDREAREELTQAVQALFLQRTREEWTAFFAAHDACCEPVLTLPEALEHPHFRSRGGTAVVPREGERYEEQPGFPLQFDGVGGVIRHPAPRLGEHTALVLQEAGYTLMEVAELRRAGVAR